MNLKSLIIGLGIVILLNDCSSKTKIIKITFTEMYCSGAAPPEEMLKDMETKKPFINRDVEVFLEGKLSPTPLKYKTNEKGELILQRKLSKKVAVSFYPTAEIFDTSANRDYGYQNCYKDFIKQNLLLVDMKNKAKLIDYSVFIMCDPCAPPHP